MSCAVSGSQLPWQKFQGAALRRSDTSRKMNKLVISVVAFVCLCSQLGSVAQITQQQSPEVFPGIAEKPAATETGDADGVRSPALTGSDTLAPKLQRHPLYRLSASDVVEITFSFAPEFNQIVTVQPDGFIPLKGIEQLYVDRLTLPEMREKVRAAYTHLLHDPEVTVALKVFEKPYFIAAGQIMRPGKYDLHGDTTVVEALSIAGGMTPEAKHSRVVLFRRRSEEFFETRVLDVKQMLNSRNLQEDIYLQPGDLVYVPQNSISKIRRFLPASNLGMYWNPARY